MSLTRPRKHSLLLILKSSSHLLSRYQHVVHVNLDQVVEDFRIQVPMLLYYSSLSLIWRQNNTRVFVLGKFFQVSLKFGIKVRAYPCGALYNAPTYRYASGLTLKYYTSLKKLVFAKHSSLLYHAIWDKENNFL